MVCYVAWDMCIQVSRQNNNVGGAHFKTPHVDSNGLEIRKSILTPLPLRYYQTLKKWSTFLGSKITVLDVPQIFLYKSNI